MIANIMARTREYVDSGDDLVTAFAEAHKYVTKSESAHVRETWALHDAIRKLYPERAKSLQYFVDHPDTNYSEVRDVVDLAIELAILYEVQAALADMFSKLLYLRTAVEALEYPNGTSRDVATRLGRAANVLQFEVKDVFWRAPGSVNSRTGRIGSCG